MVRQRRLAKKKYPTECVSPGWQGAHSVHAAAGMRLRQGSGAQGGLPALPSSIRAWIAAGRAAPLFRPLWGQHATQVPNTPPLARIRVFLHFPVDIAGSSAKIVSVW